MTFRCIGCRQEKPLTEFYPTKQGKRGHYSRCRTCWAQAGREWRQRNREAAKRYRADYRRTHRKELAHTTRRSDLKTRYGITPERYDELFQIQGGKCHLCGDPPESNRRPCVDHAHSTGVVRALLCDRCNAGLGAFRDNPELMRRAAAFVSAYMDVAL